MDILRKIHYEPITQDDINEYKFTMMQDIVTLYFLK